MADNESVMVPFQYREFYDVPRCLIVHYQRSLILLQSTFDEQLDDYESDYSVYRLPDSVEEALLGDSWKFLDDVSKTFIGRIPVSAVRYDSTKREGLDPACLDDAVGSVG